MTEKSKFIKKVEIRGKDLPDSLYNLFDDIQGLSKGFYADRITKKNYLMTLTNVNLTEEVLATFAFVGAIYAKDIASIYVKVNDLNRLDPRFDPWKFHRDNEWTFYSWSEFMATLVNKKDE